jgi:hypothetical protein
MNNEPLQFSLIDSIKTIWAWRKQIAIFTIVVAIATAAYAFSLKNQYKSYSIFYPANSIIGSRDNMFRTEWQDAIDAFGLEHEVDRMYTIGNSAPTLSFLIKKYNLMKHYRIDSTASRANEKVYKQFDKNFQVMKGANGNLELSVIDENMDTAAAIGNDALIVIQDNYRDYFIKSSQGIAEAMQVRQNAIDSTLKVLTDSLVNMREKYGIYELINPSRKGNTSTSSRNARGIEEVQTVEELKDKLVQDKAKYESIKNEFLTVQHKSIPFIHVVQYPEPNGKKASPFRTAMVLGAAALAAFLASIFVVILQFVKSRNLLG